MANRGYTLVEVIIAAGLMALSLSMIIGTVVLLKRSVYSTDYRLVALHEARNQMETLLSLPYTNALLSSGAHAFATPSGSYTGIYSVSTNAAFPGVKNISLSIYWINPGMSNMSSNTIISAISEPLH